VSRHHARLTVDGTAATLEDLGSKNGTYLEGRLLRGAMPLSDGDEIAIGPALFAFRAAGKTRTTKTATRSRRRG
jgi:pSer/pThr/pTyr-binding forkhead associated (FHA) protein